MRVPNDHLAIEPGIEVQRLSGRIALSEPKDERSVCIAKRNRCDDNDIARSEGLRSVVTERVLQVSALDGWVWEREGLSVVDLVNVLHILVHRNAANVLEGQSELERAVGRPIDGDVKTIVAHQDVDLESVPWKHIQTRG